MRKRSEKSGGDAEVAQNSAASLVRGLGILRCFSLGDDSLSNQEIIQRTGLPKATISRLCTSLVELGYLDYNQQTGRYSLGAATVSLGYSALSSNAVLHIASPMLDELSKSTGTSVALAARDRKDMVYLGSWRSFSPVALRLVVGSHVPLARTAMGMAYLAGLNDAEFDHLLMELPEHDDDLRRARTTARADYLEKGFVTAYGTWYSYINSVGIPFRPSDGSPAIAITCGSITDILSTERCDSFIGPALAEIGRKLSNSLNNGGSDDEWLPLG